MKPSRCRGLCIAQRVGWSRGGPRGITHYAGTYVYGRTGSQVRIEYGRKRISRGIPRPQDKWDVLIHDHHKGYISWNDYERNQGIINSNANMKGAMVKGSVREGGGVLAGLLRCGHCGRKLNILHNNADGSARYV